MLAGGWILRGFATIVLLLAIVAAMAAWTGARAAGNRQPAEARWTDWLAVGGGLGAAVISALQLVDRLGGPLEPRLLVPSAALAAAGLGLLAATVRAVRSASSAWPMALGGIALVVAGIGLGLTVGGRAVGVSTSLSVAAMCLAVAAIGASGEAAPVRWQVAAGAVAVVLAAVSATFAWHLVETFARSNFGFPDRVFLGVHLAGLAVVIAAALRAAVRPGSRRRLRP